MSLIFENITYSYPSITDLALSNVSGVIETGNVTALIGNSGSGKSTLGMILKGLISMDGGSANQLNLDGTKSKLNNQQLLTHVGWTPANPEIQFFATTVKAEVAFGLINQGVSGDELDERVKSAIEIVGLNYDMFKNRHPLFLSGGEKRLVALAGVVVMGFKWYIFDEMTVGLDYKGWKSVRELFTSLTDSGAGVCWISHDLKSLKDLSQNVIELNDGRLEYAGSSVEYDWDGCLYRMTRSYD